MKYFSPYFLAGTCCLLLSGCLKQQFENDAAKYQSEQIEQNVLKVFGVNFSPEQTWSSTVNGTISIYADADLDDIVKVQILSGSPFGSDDANGVTLLNEASAKKGDRLTLNYDAPSAIKRLYVACVSADGEYRIKGFVPGQETLSFAYTTTRAAEEPATRALPADVVLGRDEASYNSLRTQQASTNSAFSLWQNSGWENDHLYQLADKDEDPQRIFVSDYTDDERADLEDIIFTYLPNKKWVNGVRYNDNLGKIRANDIFRYEHHYMTTTGTAPITFAPIYSYAGDEIKTCHIYYYYYRPEQIAGMSEAEEIQFLKNLPKYKAIQLYRVIRDNNLPNDVVKRTQQYTLLYWGDGTPTVGSTKAQYTFPAGYKIGVMIRSIKTSKLTGTSNGCLYGDGRLNNEINFFGDFKNAKLEANDPRVAIFGANGKNYICFEDGADQDFNDMIVEVEGGVKTLANKINPNRNVYTFCFEDHIIGDYDLNDVVIKAERVDPTHIKMRLVACGASDDLYLRNISGTKLNTETEVHVILNSVPRFINVKKNDAVITPVEETFEVESSFTFTDLLSQIKIFNATENHEVELSEKGEDPHGIMIPCDFRYPIEGICIKDAYPEFNNWGQNPVTSTDWYLYPAIENVY